MGVLVAWIGITDLKVALGKSNPGELGPIFTAIKEGDFSQFYFLITQGEVLERIEDYRIFLKQNGVDLAHVSFIKTTIGGDLLIDYKAIFEVTKHELGLLLQEQDSNTKVTFHLTPGTAVM